MKRIMEFEKFELDIIVAALNYAGIARNSFMEHLTEQGHFETAMNVRDDMDDLKSLCLHNLNELRSNDG